MFSIDRQASLSMVAIVFIATAIVASPICTSRCHGQQVETGTLGKGRAWQTDFHIVDTGLDGPTVLITGGVHGNEPAGTRAAEQILHWPITRGKLITIPRANTLGVKERIRFVPNAPDAEKDLNRNFPSPDAPSNPRGAIASTLWRFVTEQNPDWLFDLHEGYEFNVSHTPPAGKSKSVGSSIIYDRSWGNAPMVERMLTAANGTVNDSDRRFVLLGRGPKVTTLANATTNVLGKQAMILETTFKRQPLALRARQHRVMMNVALRQLDMITTDCVEITGPPVGDPIVETDHRGVQPTLQSSQ